MLKILKVAYYRNYCTDSNQILHSDRDHQNTLRGWSKQAYNKSKMADGRHLEKSKTAISPQRFVQAAQNLSLGFTANECVKTWCHPLSIDTKMFDGMTRNDINAAKLSYFTEFSR